MYDLYTVPEISQGSRPMPRWVQIALFGPFLAVLTSILFGQMTQSFPSLHEAAGRFFLLASAGFALGCLSVLGACIVHLISSTWRASRMG
jgi:hypothetical protein